MKLNDIKCKNLKPKEKPYKEADGKGMYLNVMPNGSKYWRMKYRFNDKERLLAIGVYPETSLSEAREKRDEARKLIRGGIDPTFEKHEQKRMSKISADNSFEIIAREWHEHYKTRWSEGHAANVLHRLEMDIFKHIGTCPITAIKPPLVLEAVRKIEARGAHEIARRTLQYCGQVFRYAIGEGKAENDPTAALTGQLKPYKKSHFAAITAKELPEFLRALDKNDARLYQHTRHAMRLMLLTFLRTSELIKAKWDEIDLDAGVWVVPAERMKGKEGQRKEHIVPLCRQAVEILRAQKETTGQWEWVFPNQVRPIKSMSNNTILKALERMGYKGIMTGHGFRALARTTIREKLNYHSEVIEKQLAHKTRTALGEAYDRTEFIDQRTTMMQDWADYLDALAGHGEVIEGKFGGMPNDR